MFDQKEVHTILDSTKIKEYMSCPRKFLFKHILGWGNESQHDLIFGQAAHKSMEYIYGEWKRTGVKKYSKELILASMRDFLSVYREHYSEETDQDNSPKNPENFLRLLLLYADEYSFDDFDVLHTEIQGSVFLDNNQTKSLFYVLDTVIEQKEGVAILEHKTSKWGTYLWQMSFELSIQIGVGNMVIHSLFDKPYGMIINGLFMRKTQNELLRLPKPMNMSMLEQWRVYAETWHDKVMKDIGDIDKEQHSDVLTIFPKNETACLQFNKLCQFCQYCQTMNNPIQERNPFDNIAAVWDPRIKEKVEV